MLVPHCDLCGARMKQEELNASDAKTAELAQQGIAAFAGRPEMFCSNCLRFSEVYWREKAGIMAELSRIMNGRLENHKRNFLKKHAKVKLEAVK